VAGRREIEARAAAVERELEEHVLDYGRLAVVKAPPGSGKTWLLLKTVAAAYKARRRIAITTQTNSQADDICERFARDYASVPVIRFAGTGASPIPLGASVTWETSVGELPTGPCVVVGTAAKWGMVTIHNPFDLLCIEEAWQLSWADFMLLGQVAERFVLIGDPGQIPPVVSVDVARWETAPRPPHLAAPSVIESDTRLRAERWSLPASRRLPADAVDLVRPFYNFEFGAFAGPGERAVLGDRGGRSAIDRAIDQLREGSVSAITLPTPDSGPPLEYDEQVASAAANVVKALLARRAKAKLGEKTISVGPQHIGLVATHRVMNAAMELALPKALRGHVRVDTPERWQGLERPVMIAVHPLSGVLRPSAFDLETGRLCVMASRHLAGMVVLGRDHLGETLRGFIPTADQPIGRPDVSGRGLRDNLMFWERLEGAGRVSAV
jgi:hypothetical protein